MDITIGAEAAKLAGLHIDHMSKLRAGQLSLEHWERFLNLTSEAREERFGDWKRPAPITIEAAKPVVTTSVKQFALLADLGTIVVPEDYVHTTFLSSFRKKNRKKFFYGYNDDITDAHFPNPTRVLRPGDQLTVRAFRQTVSRTTSEERMEFLKTQNAVLTGAQGAALVFDQKRDQLPKGYWHASMDEPDRLRQDAERSHRVPGVCAYVGGDFDFRLGHFEDEWHDRSTLLVFCDVPALSGA